jgi:hypothetical protein
MRAEGIFGKPPDYPSRLSGPRPIRADGERRSQTCPQKRAGVLDARAPGAAVVPPEAGAAERNSSVCPALARRAATSSLREEETRVSPSLAREYPRGTRGGGSSCALHWPLKRGQHAAIPPDAEPASRNSSVSPALARRAATSSLREEETRVSPSLAREYPRGTRGGGSSSTLHWSQKRGQQAGEAAYAPGSAGVPPAPPASP